MNPDIKTQWLSALRSGKYPQTQEALHRIEKGRGGQPVGFCCLGVLCDLAEQAGVVRSAASPDDSSMVGYTTRTRGGLPFIVTGLLPREVQEWAGLSSSSGLLILDRDRSTTDTLSSLNDSGKTFAEIADIIEEHA